jgi:hypothetical protein
LITLAFPRCAAAQQSIESLIAEPRESARIETPANAAPATVPNSSVRPDGGSITYIQYLLTATGESVPNAYPVSTPSYGDPSSSCTYSQSTLSLLPCYNPLKIQFDVVLPANFTISNSSSSPSTLPIASLTGYGPPNLLMLTNSIDSTDGGVSSISASAYCTGLTTIVNVTVTNEDSSVFHFTSGSNLTIPCTLLVPFNGSLSSSTTGDTGSFSLAPQYIISGTYAGNFSDSGTPFGSAGNSQLNITVDANFTASGTVTVAPSSICSAQTSTLSLSSSGSLAQANGVAPGVVGISVGDSVELAASDSTTLIWLIASDENALGNTLGAGYIFVTGYVVSGVCAGAYFWDAPFHLATQPVRHMPPVAPRPRNILVHPAWRLAFRN